MQPSKRQPSPPKRHLAAAPAFTFATTPAEANDQPLDMSSAIGQKFFKTATEPLATPFDGMTQGLRLFLYFVAQAEGRVAELGPHHHDP